MTTPSAPISLSDVQTEFGGTNPISINEYYGTGNVVPTNLGVPASGTISLGQFRNITNYFTFQTTQTGINTSTGTVVGVFTPNLNGFGPYPTRTLDSLAWTTTFNVASLTIFQSAFIDYGYNIFIAINGVWNTTAIASIVHTPAGQGFVSGTATVAYSIPANSSVQFGFSTGPFWQQILSSGTCTVTFTRA